MVWQRNLFEGLECVEETIALKGFFYFSGVLKIDHPPFVAEEKKLLANVV